MTIMSKFAKYSMNTKHKILTLHNIYTLNEIDRNPLLDFVRLFVLFTDGMHMTLSLTKWKVKFE